MHRVGEGPSVPPWDPNMASVPVGMVVLIVLLILIVGCILVDITCCKVNDAGVTYYICVRKCRSNSKNPPR